ncbi:hypothetical protein PG984_003014 [Apiospora sp. TS-2023a]
MAETTIDEETTALPFGRVLVPVVVDPQPLLVLDDVAHALAGGPGRLLPAATGQLELGVDGQPPQHDVDRLLHAVGGLDRARIAADFVENHVERPQDPRVGAPEYPDQALQDVLRGVILEQGRFGLPVAQELEGLVQEHVLVDVLAPLGPVPLPGVLHGADEQAARVLVLRV